MIIEKNVEIRTRDGTVLRANVFRPDGDVQAPVLMVHGPYGKDVHFADAFKPQWDLLKAIYPGIDTEGSSGQYLRWEVADPERWVPWGYAIVVVDSRGAGESPGHLWVWSPQEVQDYVDCIAWAGTQAWSSGKVGLLGISYYAMNQWQVAAQRPPHLAAICPWEGAADFYRDVSHHGGIFSNRFFEIWYPKQILTLQNGNAQSPFVDRQTQAITTGAPLSREQLDASRTDIIDELRARPLMGDWYDERTGALDQINVPLLSAGNWGGMGLHLRGNVQGFVGAGSQKKWLQLHGGGHWESFYLPDYVQMQKRFFDCFLKGVDNGWEDQPPVLLDVRHVDRFVPRAEAQWPLARTQWTPMYLDAAAQKLGTAPGTAEGAVSYPSPQGGVEFASDPLPAEMEFTGPASAVLWVQSSTSDMDLFLTLRAYDPQGTEVVFRGATDPAVPIAQGWLRVSQRETDAAKSLPGQPHHVHRQALPMTPGEAYRVEVEIWPTSIVLPAGYTIALRVEARDFERADATDWRKGSGPFLHNDPSDRSPAATAGTHTILTGGRYDAHLLLPLIPAAG